MNAEDRMRYAAGETDALPPAPRPAGGPVGEDEPVGKDLDAGPDDAAGDRVSRDLPAHD